jgi:hypothetical protein
MELWKILLFLLLILYLKHYRVRHSYQCDNTPLKHEPQRKEEVDFYYPDICVRENICLDLDLNNRFPQEVNRKGNIIYCWDLNLNAPCQMARKITIPT